MKYLPRIAGLLLGAFLLAGALPRQEDWLSLLRVHHASSISSAIAHSPSVVSDYPESASPASPAVALNSATADAARLTDSPPDSDFESISPQAPGIAAALVPDSSTRLVTPTQGDDVLRPGRIKAAASVAATPLPAVEQLELFTYVPPNAAQRQPLRVVVALHGMGGQGDAFAKYLVSDADRNSWVLVAPTIPYRDYFNIKLLLEDDVRFARALEASLKTLPERIRLPVKPDVILFGYSRGAQFAHRFAFFFPERVNAVVALSAGAYTLPSEKRQVGSGSQPLPLPFGVSDCQTYGYRSVDWESFRKISFWIGVGGKDSAASDVARAFDPYIGNTRIERARAFNAALEKLGVKSRLVIFPNAGHEVTAEMRREAVNFLQERELQVKSGR